ncbi:MAG: CDP-diacylglycerol--glycerol-3-phosphate 3-phosphatidyltransferase [Lachnospiraceae bacterium]|nr:CDP-diacylglycerol--glycerol-3-phosphate 3-phosphatidyltransferase [Lachnospiraceae bacterium]
MNLPNKLTVLRMLLIPVFVVLLLSAERDESGVRAWAALAIFVIASLTDFFDGRIARKRGLVSNFGKLMDPLADKLLVCSALICLSALSRIPAWVVIVIIAREFVITGVRQLAAEKGRVIAASYWGKFKTASQMVMIILMIADLPALTTVTQAFLWIAFALTIISMIDYLVKNRDIILEGEI